VHRLLHTLCRAAVAGFTLAVVAPVAQAQPLPTVLVAATQNDDATEVLYAIHSGIFRRLGIDAQMSVVTSSTAAAAGIVGGSLQFATGSVFTVPSARSHGVPLEFVAPTGVYQANLPYAVVVKGDSPIRTARDMNGKVCGVNQTGDINLLMLRAWIDRNGGDSTSVRAVEMPYPAMSAAVDAGRIDAALILGPALQEIIDTGKFRVLGRPIDALAYGNNKPVITAWFTSSAYAAANPRIVQAFARGILEAAAYANAHHAETAPLIAQYSGVDVATIEHGTRTTFREAIDPQDVQPALDVLFKYKLTATHMVARDLFSSAVLELPS